MFRESLNVGRDPQGPPSPTNNQNPPWDRWPSSLSLKTSKEGESTNCSYYCRASGLVFKLQEKEMPLQHLEELPDAAEPLGNSQSLQRLPQILAFAGDSVTINCNVSAGKGLMPLLTWFKEEQDRSLRKIEERSSKYSRRESSLTNRVNLTLHRVQRNDSGVYYCRAYVRIVSGTRLIVSDAQNPSLSIFLLSSLEGAQRNHSLPLLCFLPNANPSRDKISWDVGGETSQEDQADVGMINVEGVFSIWSLKLIPPERQIPGTYYSCLNKGNRHLSAMILMDPLPRGKCLRILYFGIPCVVILLSVLALILLFRKHLFGGEVEKQAHEIPMRQIQQTDYTELRCNR
ncbi:gamma-secretase subunit APH-1A isoform X1 [Sceloporus undulatus]|uniref:gamma-secretase subunit APH-1A isoform X1 n=1 Tax=Sceloporus undulatus TaxID=8520 RepID=UPI001C4B8C60|nr:gamma-secretase subunit APH-1A isoform X1 [Sceloporus undulatus]